MQLTCKNCSHKFKGNFCNFCGQSANTHRMDLHSMWHDIQHGILHIEKGFFYTIQQLFSRPGHAIREFLEGKRVKHFKPIPLVFILAGIYALLYHYFDIKLFTDLKISSNTSENVTNIFEKINKWRSQHYALVTIFGLPIFTLGTFWAFKKVGYNFVELFVLISFIEAQKLVINIVLFPLTYLFTGTEIGSYLSTIINLIAFCLMLWTMFQFFTQYGKKYTFFRTLLSLLISYAIIIICIILVVIVVIMYTNEMVNFQYTIGG